ncbi:MAG: ABC transporter permease [Romboutsia sp.]
MSNLVLLIKNNIINEFKLNKIKNSDRKEKSKIIGMALIFIFTISILVRYLFILCFLISDFLVQINQMELLLLAGFLGSTLFTMFTSLYKASSYLFNAKDFYMLISLPIKESTILTSKVLMLVFTNYIFSLGFILIPSIVYFMKVDTGITYFLYLFILFLSLPMIPIVISCIISFVLGNVSSRVKYKNTVLVIGSITILITYIGLLSQIEIIGKVILENSTSIMGIINKLYPPSYYFIDALKNNNLMSLAIFVGMSLIPFLIFTTIFSKGFKNINSRMNESYKVKNYKFKELKISNQRLALLKKEFSRYFSSYIYLLNSFIGMILLMIGTVGIVIFGAEQIDSMLQLNLDMDMLKPQMIVMILSMIIMTCTTYCSISLEGNNLWILKSSPIEEIDIFKSKIYMNIILNMPIPIICFIAISLKLKFDIAFILIMIGTIISISILISVGGLLANLLLPNLDWKNEVAVVKRSASMIVILFGGILYIGFYGAIYYFTKITNLNTILIIATIITFIINVILWKIIKSKGVKIFRSL